MHNIYITKAVCGKGKPGIKRGCKLGEWRVASSIILGCEVWFGVDKGIGPLPGWAFVSTMRERYQVHILSMCL